MMTWGGVKSACLTAVVDASIIVLCLALPSSMATIFIIRVAFIHAISDIFMLWIDMNENRKLYVSVEVILYLVAIVIITVMY